MKAINSTVRETSDWMQDESDVCETCLDQINGLQNENDCYRALLRKNKIVIPEIPGRQKQPTQSKLLEEAYQVIDDLNSQIFKLKESIKAKDKWLADFNQILIAQTTNFENQTQQNDGFQADSKYSLDKLQDNHCSNVGYLREYAKSHPKQAKEKPKVAAEKQLSDA